MDIDLRDALKLVETETLLWAEAQLSLTQRIDQMRLPVEAIVPSILVRWCFIDGSWKKQETYSGQGWYNTLESFDDLMGAKNTRVSQLPLHSETKTPIWAMKCMRNHPSIKQLINQSIKQLPCSTALLYLLRSYFLSSLIATA